MIMPKVGSAVDWAFWVFWFSCFGGKPGGGGGNSSWLFKLCFGGGSLELFGCGGCQTQDNGTAHGREIF